MDKIRDQHSRHDRYRDDEKLLDRLFERQSGQDHKPDTEQQTHIVDDQPVSFRIDHAEQHHRSKHQYLLQHIEKQIFYVPRLKAYDKKARKMYQKHKQALAKITTATALLVLITEHKKALQCIKCHKQRNKILGKFSDI